MHESQDSDLKTLYLAIERGHDLVVAQLMRYNPNFKLETMVRDDNNDTDEEDDNDDNEKERILARCFTIVVMSGR